MDADFLIIGGGTAGCVLASRLSEDSSLRIVLVEAGADTPPGRVPPDIADVFPRAYANSAYFWPELCAVARAGSAPKPYSQARILGGGSSIMGLWSLRGLPADYDGWAAAGATGWAFADVLPFFRKLERDVDVVSSEHGTADHDCPPAARGLAAFQQSARRRRGRHRPSRPAGREFDRRRRHLRHTDRYARRDQGFGASRLPDRGRPSPPEPHHRDRGHCDPLRRTEGRRRHPSKGRRKRRHLAREHGRGFGGGHPLPRPFDALRHRSRRPLKAAGIAVLHEQDQVGRNLQNHLFLHLGAVIRPGMRQSPALRTYAIGGARLSSGQEGAPEGDLFVSFIARTSGYANGNRLGMVGPSLYAPYSRGSVRLDPRNPKGEPLVDFNLLADPRDAKRLLHAARFSRGLLEDARVRAATFEAFVLPPNPPIRLLNQPGLSSAALGHAITAMVALPRPVRRAALRRVLAPGKLLADISGEAEFSDLALAGATPMFHPACTCAIGAVVDTQARVIGVENLRVVDASIMPTIPRGNTNIPTLMLAEKCAAQIRFERHGSSPQQA
jgi:choline dehydrogenase-like flavoprotein